ncbi:MAG: dihydropteroate synthase [Fibrobacterota bacterium]
MRIGNATFDFSERPWLFGILNVTPDSFYDQGRHFSPEAALERAHALEADGADIIDVGGESTRPGSEPVPEEEELRRVIPVIRALAGRASAPISIDTCKPAVAKAALEAGVAIINYVGALSPDPAMLDLAAAARVPIVLMHMLGTPRTMQENPVYADTVREVGDGLLGRAQEAEQRGIPADRIILDPGIGFGKRLEDNLALIRGFTRFINGRYPVMMGASRKRFIGLLTGRTDPGERLHGSLGAAAAAALHGARFLRVHDVRETRDLLAVFCALRRDPEP